MKNIKKVAFQIYKHWFWITLATLSIGVWKFGWSSWGFAYLAIVSGLLVLSNSTNWAVLKPVRFLTWPLMRDHMISIVSKNAMFGYPMLIHLEISGRKIFLDGGQPALQNSMVNQLDQISNNFQSAITKMADERIAKIKNQISEPESC